MYNLGSSISKKRIMKMEKAIEFCMTEDLSKLQPGVNIAFSRIEEYAYSVLDYLCCVSKATNKTEHNNTTLNLVAAREELKYIKVFLTWAYLADCYVDYEMDNLRCVRDVDVLLRDAIIRRRREEAEKYKNSVASMYFYTATSDHTLFDYAVSGTLSAIKL